LDLIEKHPEDYPNHTYGVTSDQELVDRVRRQNLNQMIEWLNEILDPHSTLREKEAPNKLHAGDLVWVKDPRGFPPLAGQVVEILGKQVTVQAFIQSDLRVDEAVIDTEEWPDLITKR
jgi:hypothetical protein